MTSETTKAGSNRKKQLLITAGSIAAAVIVYFIVQQFLYVTTDDAQIDGHFVMLAAKVSGYITDVKVTEGQKVKKGDVLVEIDGRDYENTYKQVSSTLVSVEAKEKDAEKSYRRLSELYKKGVVSQQQYDTASAGYAEVKANYDSVAAQVSQAELNLENTKVRAPSDGFIAKKSAEVGQLAAVGVPLIGFVDAQERWVTANFKETEIAHIRPGQRVDIDVDAVNGKSYRGQIDSISSATGATFTLLPPDNATGNFTKVVQRVPVKIKFDGLSPDDFEKLRVGLSAYVRVAVRGG